MPEQRGVYTPSGGYKANWDDPLGVFRPLFDKLMAETLERGFGMVIVSIEHGEVRRVALQVDWRKGDLANVTGQDG